MENTKRTLIETKQIDKNKFLEVYQLENGKTLRRIVKNSKQISKNQYIKTLRMVTDENEVVSNFRKIIKENVKIKNNNISKIMKSFNHDNNKISNYELVNLDELFDFGNINKVCDFYNNRYRVFMKIDSDVVFMSIFDIISILFDIEFFKYQIIKLDEIFNYKSVENKFREEFKEKNKNNIEFLSKNFGLNEKTMSKVRDVAIEMNKHEKEFFNKINRDKFGVHYIFVSRNHIAEKLNMAPSSVSESLNMLTFLRLIEKVDYENISLEEEIRINKSNEYKNVTLYSIPNYKEFEDIIFEMFEIVRKNNLSKRDITKKKLESLFGINESERVFKDTNKKRK